jgi:hypothetical protein
VVAQGLRGYGQTLKKKNEGGGVAVLGVQLQGGSKVCKHGWWVVGLPKGGR